MPDVELFAVLPFETNMNRKAMKPQGLALLDYWEGDPGATFSMRSDDGEVMQVRAGIYFRSYPEWPEVERTAVDLCRGRVLDVGAGAGCHSLFLQQRGHEVTAIDILPECVQVMRERGVRDVRMEDVFRFRDDPYDTILMMMNGIGFVETLRGLERFLNTVGRLLKDDGQILFDSSDGRYDIHPEASASVPVESDREPYFGEVEMRLEYRGIIGTNFRWLYVDTDTLAHYAEKCGWNCRVVQMEADGLYLAQLEKRRS